jgi:hypothetical protein
MNTPDVTVVVPVYNTMPYLTRCLTSLMEQTIGRDRLEVVAVDDGSTDGSGAELDRFAQRYPQTVRVVHQANSGGPASPCNRALDLARGRYVFFLGADDHLATYALERLVAAADRYDSDIVLGRSVGVNNRYIHQAVYARSAPEIDLADSGLAWSLSNTKLFRRELIERHGLRYREHMPLYSDQPFTLEAVVRARRISVLADADYYYAVRRLDARNITFRSRHEDRLHAVRELITFVTGLLEPGKQRDAVLTRHFTWEVAKLLEDDFLRLDADLRQRVVDFVAEMVDRHLTDEIRARLDIEPRVRLAVAARGSVADVTSVIEYEARHGVPPTLVRDERWFAAYPGVLDPDDPDPRLDVTPAAADWLARMDVTGLAWGRAPGGGRALTVTAHTSWRDLATLVTEPVQAVALGVPARTLSMEPDAAGTTVRLQFPVDQLLAVAAPRGDRQLVRLRLGALGRSGSAALRVPGAGSTVRLVRRYGARPYLITATRDHGGHLVIAIAPITPQRVLARLVRRPRGGK